MRASRTEPEGVHDAGDAMTMSRRAPTSAHDSPTAAESVSARTAFSADDQPTADSPPSTARRGLVVTKTVDFARPRGQREAGRTEPQPPEAGRGRVPRVARLMALAIRFDALLRDGAVSSQAELAQVGHVTRARVTQIMNLLWLAPDLQEAILFLPELTRGRDPVTEHQLREVAAILDWNEQRVMWQKLATHHPCV